MTEVANTSNEIENDPTKAPISSLDLKLMMNEVFYSIQGESSLAGWPTVFLRTTGCNIRCTYCDTKYSYYEGSRMSIGELIEKVRATKTKHVCVTGGEPMSQKNVLVLMKELCDRGYIVSLETNGYYDCSEVDPRVIKVIDIKTPDSGEVKSFNKNNLNCLLPHDQIKFVICSEKDFEFARDFVRNENLDQRCSVFFSPAFDSITPQFLAEKILTESLPVRLQLQLHKYIWNPHSRGV